MSNRKNKKKWKVVQDNNLYYPELNKGTTDDSPIWIRENIEGFSTLEGAEDYISKTVILEKNKFVSERNN